MSPEDRAELKALIHEVLDEREEPTSSALRQKRYRDRKRYAKRYVTRYGLRGESVTSRVTQRQEKESSNGFSPLSPPLQSPLLSPQLPLLQEKEEKQLKRACDLEGLLTQLKPIYPHLDLEIEKARIRGWMLANPSRQLTRRFVVNWLNKIEKPLSDSPVPEKQKFVTKAMIDDWCERKKYSKLAPIARGKLMSGKHYGVPINNAEDFNDAMSALLSDWLAQP